MVDLAEIEYERGVLEGFAKVRIELYSGILSQLGEETLIRIYGPKSKKGLSQEHITTLIEILKTKDINEGIKEYADYLSSNMDEEVSKSMQKCIRAYRVEATATRLKEHQSADGILDYLCSHYEISVREAADIIEDAQAQIQEEYEEARLKRSGKP